MAWRVPGWSKQPLARKPGNDERQENFFGRTARPKAAAGGTPGRGRRAPAVADAPEPDGLEVQLGRLSFRELRDVAALLSDESLAHLTLAVIRQLRRRLGRDSRAGDASGSRKGNPVLDRAVQELIATFSEAGDEDDF